MEETSTHRTQKHWQDSLPNLIKLTPEPDDGKLSALHQQHIPAAPSLSSSSLFAALDVDAPPTQPAKSSHLNRTSPPPFYNPYPYPKTWTLERKLKGRERWLWHHREDDWMRHSDGDYILEVRQRVCSVFTSGIRARQLAAKKEWEEAQVLQQVPPETSEDGIHQAFDFQFVTSQEEKGISVKTLLSGRRAIEAGLMSPKVKAFENYPHDSMQIRIQWPAYPDHNPVRTIVVTMRTGKKRSSRRPCTRLEFAVALAGLVTQYYSEASLMEPHPAFAHLALGPGGGRISLYALRLFGVRATPNGIFELELELNSSQPQPEPQQQSPSASVVSSPAATAPETKDDPDLAVDASGYPTWERTLPVTCTAASPPKITAAQFFAHVNPLSLTKIPLPAWPQQ